MEGIRRGHLRFYILKLLLKDELTGYGLMKKIEEETGFWKPSTGSLYPLLNEMKGLGLITKREGKGWAITEAGRSVYEQATDVKETLFENMRKSMLVFAKVFGRTDLEELFSRIDRWKTERMDLLEPARALMRIYDAIWSLPPLSEEKKGEIIEMLDSVSARIEAYGEGSG